MFLGSCSCPLLQEALHVLFAEDAHQLSYGGLNCEALIFSFLYCVACIGKIQQLTECHRILNDQFILVTDFANLQQFRKISGGHGWKHDILPVLCHRITVQNVQYFSYGNRFFDLAVLHAVHSSPSGCHRQLIVAALRCDRFNSVIGYRESRQRLNTFWQRDHSAGKNQLEDQHKGHYRHGGSGRMGDAGDKQAHHIRRIGNQQQRNAKFHNPHMCGENALLRKRNPCRLHHIQADNRLDQAQEELIDHMRRHIRGDMHTGAMFPLDNRPFPADCLDRIEASVPQCYAGQREGADDAALHVGKDPVPDHHRHQHGNHHGHGDYFPVAFIDKEPELFAQVDRYLAQPVAVPERSFLFNDCLRHAAPPCT